jgi:hypothetical protein
LTSLWGGVRNPTHKYPHIRRHPVGSSNGLGKIVRRSQEARAAVIDLGSFYTFSGLFVFGALVAILNRWLTAGGLLLTIAGAGGIGIFWERWSQLAGDNVHITAFLTPVAPTEAQFRLLITHLAMLVAGVILIVTVARKQSANRSNG